ncbi:MAG: hypothetical protein LBM68_00435 [Bacteroidales bacterium]|jgi:hypothetical protein|nr:hypothetical protein [Bacteroidales bacterium]
MEERKKNITPRVLLIIVAALFVLHFTQFFFEWIPLKPLSGYFEKAKKSTFSWKKWFDGTYQAEEEKYLNENFGFRSFFVRFNHQWRFSLFNEVKTQSVIVGAENYLYEFNYIKAWYGTDFIGYDTIAQRMYKLQRVQDTLQKLGKHVIVILAPGKGSFYPEYIPERYHQDRGVTNIDVYRHYIDSLNINCIDFNQYFVDNKAISPYPLYPQYGIHWSYYGVCLAADSIVSYLEKINDITMAHLYWDKIDMRQPEKGDNDISAAMNLLFAPRTFNMAYPEVKFESRDGKTKPSLLVVSDSFYWSIFNMGFGRLLENYHFWYYNKEIFPGNRLVSEANLYNEIMEHDNILIISTDANLPQFGWGFIENAYDVFFSN